MRPLIAGLWLFAIAAGQSAAAAGTLVVQRLRCEYRVDPVGIGETQPRLGWGLAAASPELKDLRQSGYQILVASSAEGLAQDRGDRWDSGRVATDANQGVVYAGAPLTSGAECWWKVRVWDQAGNPSDWSQSAHYSIGLVDPSAWHAQWIGLDSDPNGGETPDEVALRQRVEQLPWMCAPLPESRTQPLTAYFRRGFTIPEGKSLTRATLLLTPDEVCAITLDGHLVASVARWDRAVPIDLLPHLSTGNHVVGLHLTQSDGYAPSVLGEFELVFADGQHFRCPIDTTWHWSPTATDGWDRPGYDSALDWKAVAPVAAGHPPWGSPQDATQYLPPAPFFRREFTVSKPIRRATLRATALGLYEAHLNGRRVGEDDFTPGWTDYRRRVQCQSYDVTSLLQPGPNALGAILGDGWFAGDVGFLGRRQIYGGFPRFAAQLELDYTDGTREEITTDGQWKAAHGPILYADLLQGYAYDARRELTGWDHPGFADHAWSPVATGLRATDDHAPLAMTSVAIQPAMLDPVRVEETLPALAVTTPAPGAYVVDFGQNLVGWARLRVTGRPGQRILVRHGEMLDPNGTLYTSNLRGAVATDVYYLRGDSPETLEPRFTFHGFRYLEITGLDRAPATADATAVVAHTALERTGDFACSNPLVNRLFQNIIWGQKGNYFEVPTDCPQRDERLGWTGDTQFFVRTASYNYNVASFLERWLLTIATDDQVDDGSFPEVAPTVGRPTHAITAWGDAAIVCCHTLWKVYGDTRVVERHLDELARYLDLLHVDSDEDIVSVGGYGDWLNKGGGARAEVIDTAYYAYLCGLMSEMAGAIGRPAEAEKYARRREAVAAAFQKAFVGPDGSIRDSSQTGYALAFTMDLLPPAVRASATQKFIAEIAAKDWHLATGFIGTPRLLPALHDAGRDDVAYLLLMQDTYPSWLFQVKNGATTMWERWDGWTPENGFQTIGMNSFNHYAFGSVGEYLYRYVAGIDTEGAGFRRIRIQPTPGAGMTWARGSFDAPEGKVSTEWHVDGDALSVDATIPPNTSADVQLPNQAPIEVGSGTYHWNVRMALPAPGSR